MSEKITTHLRPVVVTIASLAPFLVAPPSMAGTDRADPSLIEIGRRIYDQGILPSGAPLIGEHRGGLAVGGADAACGKCHRRSGYGSVEGKTVVPPVAAPVLFAPGSFSAGLQRGPDGRALQPHSLVERYRARSAYDDRLLARALGDGVDPDSIELAEPMPRYALDRRAFDALSAYLHQLSAAPSPGVEPGVLHLATVVTPDAPAATRQAVLEVVRAYAADQAQWGARWDLQVWELSGPPQDWASQLLERYRREPVFAVVSGAGADHWEPVQRFCAQQAVACILPSLDAAPEDDEYHSLYFSPGLILEAGILARQLAAESTQGKESTPLQIYADEAGRASATRLAAALGTAPRLRSYDPATALAGIGPDETLVLWLRPEALADLARRQPQAPDAARTFVSAQLAAPEETDLPPAWKERILFVSGFDPLARRRSIAAVRPWLARNGIPLDRMRARADAFAACSLLSQAIAALHNDGKRGIAGPLTRERTLEKLEELMTRFRANETPYYWQTSLANGQRTAVKAGALVRFASPQSDDLMLLGGRIAP